MRPDLHLCGADDGIRTRDRAFVTRHYRPTIKKTELPARLRFHDLRHTCATLLIAAGAHVDEIKDHLGHASIHTTSDRYGHLYDAARDRLRDHLDETYTNAVTANSCSA